MPVVPVALKGMWGTWTSRQRGKALKGIPSQLFKKITLVAGEPVAAEQANRLLMFDQVLALRGDEK